MTRIAHITVRCLPLLFVFSIAPALGEDYAIDWHTIDGGGGTSTGGSYTLSGTIGQPDATAAAAMTGGNYTLTGGFWAVTLPACTTFVPPDVDRDCDVDDADFNSLAACVSGPDVPNAPECAGKDFDADGDVDHDDFGVLQRCHSGPNFVAQPHCAE